MFITLEEARTLDAVAKWESFSKAAQALGKGHSAVVYSLRELENKTGLVLLDRSGYRTKLTSTGRVFLSACRSLLEKERDLNHLCAELSSGWEPEVRIVLEGIVPFESLTRVLKDFLKNKIPTKFNVRAAFVTGVESTFTELEADFMISVLPPQKLSLQSASLPPLKAFLVAHKDHPLATGSKRHLIEDLKRHVFITVRGSDPRLNLSTQALDQDSSFCLNDFYSKKIAVLSGMGFGWLPKYLIDKELRTGVLKVIHWEKSSQHLYRPYLYYWSENRLGRAGRKLVKLLTEKPSKGYLDI